MTEYENEPIPGLPANLPEGERILWQGKPDWQALARSAFHTRLISGYFAVLAAWALVSTLSDGVTTASDLAGFAMTVIAGIVGVALLHLLAWGSARSTIYTLTNRRVVLRIGIALPKCINLPLGMIAAIDLAARPGGTGDVALAVIGRQRLGYIALWPHARPWKLGSPQPLLRALPDAATIASLVARTCIEANPQGHIAQPVHQPRAQADPVPGFAEAAVA